MTVKREWPRGGDREWSRWDMREWTNPYGAFVAPTPPPAFADVTAALVYKTSVQSIADSTETAVVWDAETFDTGSFFDVSSNTRFTIIRSMGYVRVAGGVHWPGNTNGDRFVNIDRNGGSFQGVPANREQAPLAAAHRDGVFSAPIAVNSGDYFEMRIIQRAGVNLTIDSSANTWMAIERVTQRTFAGALIVSSNNFSIAHNTVQAFSAQAAEYDVGSLWDIASRSLLRVPSGYNYARVYGGARWQSGSAGVRLIRIRKNGADVVGVPWKYQRAAVSNSTPRMTMAGAIVQVNSGDYFEMEVYHNQGSAQNLLADAETYFGMELFA